MYKLTRLENRKVFTLYCSSGYNSCACYIDNWSADMSRYEIAEYSPKIPSSNLILDES